MNLTSEQIDGIMTIVSHTVHGVLISDDPPLNNPDALLLALARNRIIELVRECLQEFREEE